MSDLVNALTTLGLRHTAAHLDDVVALATKRRWSTTQLLEYLAESEQQERTRRSLERRLLRSRLGRFTPMSHFDWAWPKRIDRPTVEATLRLDFLAGARNVVLVAPPGPRQDDDRAEHRPRRRPRRPPRTLQDRRRTPPRSGRAGVGDRKSTRLNSSHTATS